MRLRDNQRQACYELLRQLERQYANLNPNLTFSECEDLIKKVWFDHYKSSPPKVFTRRGRRATGSRTEIILPPHTRTMFIVLHELAHSILAKYEYTEYIEHGTNESFAPHGPEFARLYLELVDTYANIPAKEIQKIGSELKPRKVKFALAEAINGVSTRRK